MSAFATRRSVSLVFIVFYEMPIQELATASREMFQLVLSTNYSH